MVWRAFIVGTFWPLPLSDSSWVLTENRHVYVNNLQILYVKIQQTVLGYVPCVCAVMNFTGQLWVRHWISQEENRVFSCGSIRQKERTVTQNRLFQAPKWRLSPQWGHRRKNNSMSVPVTGKPSCSYRDFVCGKMGSQVGWKRESTRRAFQAGKLIGTWKHCLIFKSENNHL